MKLAEIIALIVAAIGLAGALEGFVKTALSTKLLALFVIGTLLLLVTARGLKNWIKVRATPGFGNARPKRSTIKLLGAVFALGILAASLVMGAWVILRVYAINIEAVVISGGGGELWIQGSRPVAKRVIVLVPPPQAFDCIPAPDSNAVTLQEDWHKPSRYLDITNFSYSQRQGVHCTPPPTSAEFDIRVDDPPGLEILNPQQRQSYWKSFIQIGGVLCIASIAFVLWPSHRRQ